MNESLKNICREDERIDDLQRNHYRIIQKKNGFCFGMDAVLLSGFVMVKRGERVIDLGTGTGIIPLLLEARTEGEDFLGVEIQEEIADMAGRSIRLNGLEGKIRIDQGDIREASQAYGKASFDVAVSNPPYMRAGHGIENSDSSKAAARHEAFCTLEDVVREASLLLKRKGRFYMVHRPRRLAEIMTVLCRYGLEPKRLKMVHPFIGRQANMVLLEALKGGGAMMKVEAPIIVFQKPGVYSEEIRTVYGY